MVLFVRVAWHKPNSSSESVLRYDVLLCLILSLFFNNLNGCCLRLRFNLKVKMLIGLKEHGGLSSLMSVLLADKYFQDLLL